MPFGGESQPLQCPETADAQRPLRWIVLLGGADDEDVVLGAGHELTIEARQTLLGHFVEELLDALELRLGAEL